MVLEDRQPDAAWKKIQQNTFTRWVNQKLEPVNVEVTDLVCSDSKKKELN